MAGIPAVSAYPLPAPGDLPPNVARWVAEPERAVLLIHDMQRFFLRPFPDSVKDQLVSSVAAVLQRCRLLGVPVGYTMQPGGMSQGERGLLMDFWGPGMRVDPADREIVEPLTPAPSDRVFTKWRYSAFIRSDLRDWIGELGRDQLIVCGVYAHVGVLMTAVEAFSHDIQPFLVADAVADFSWDYHRLALDYAAQRCAMVVTAKEVLA